MFSKSAHFLLDKTRQSVHGERQITEPHMLFCGTIYNSEEELNAHSNSDHKTLPSPEKECSMASLGERQLSPIHMQRDEEKLSVQEGSSSPTHSAASPPRSWFCGMITCVKTFTNEDDLRVHYHLDHGKCIRDRYTTLCPWERCDSHKVFPKVTQ